MSTHTPGPWTTEPNGGDDDDPRKLFICAPDGAARAIAEAYSSPDEGDPEANARLIAAAPDLLGALQQAISSRWLSIDLEHNRTKEACDIRAAICAAIAKAEYCE